MKVKVLIAALAVAAIPVGSAMAASPPPGNDSGLPGCEPSTQTPMKCHDKNGNTITVVAEPPGANCVAGGIKVTVDKPGTKDDETFFVCNGVPGATGPPGPPGPPGAPGAPGVTPVVTVVPGPGANQFTITVNGVPTVITIPTVPTRPQCQNTRKSAVLGPLPTRFKPGMRVGITSKGHTQFARVKAKHKVIVRTGQLPCGVYPLVVRHPPLKPAWRIWSLTGGNTLNKFWFPGLPTFSGPGPKLNT